MSQVPLLPKIKTVEDVELKAFDILTVPQDVPLPTIPWRYTVGGTFILLNDITQGTGYDQRVGTSVRIKRIQIKGSIITFMPISLNIQNTRCRTLIVWDKDPIGVGLTSTGLFKDPAWPASSQLNLDNRAEHVIVWDSLWCTGYASQQLSTIRTFWTRTVDTVTPNTIITYPAGSPPVPPTVNTVTTYGNAVLDMGSGVGNDTGIVNTVKTYINAGKLHKKVDKDFFVDLYTYFREGFQVITTGSLWLVMVRDPYVGGLGSEEFSLEASVRIRYTDKVKRY